MTPAAEKLMSGLRSRVTFPGGGPRFDPPVILDVQRFLEAGLVDSSLCEVELGTDGVVTFSWFDDKATFALCFRGNGHVVGVLSPSEPGFPWRISVYEFAALREKLREKPVAGMIKKRSP